MLNLKNLITKEERVSEVVFDKDHDVSISLKYISRPDLQKMMDRNTKTDFNKKTHRPEQNLDGEAFIKELAKTVVKGWKGMKPKFLRTFLTVDESQITDENEELPFNDENLGVLIEHNYEFSSWLSDQAKDAANFTEKKDIETKN